MASFFDQILTHNPHLKGYMESKKKEIGQPPEFHEFLTGDMGKRPNPNILYPIGDPLFIHVYTSRGTKRYIVVEPALSDESFAKSQKILDLILKKAPSEPVHDTREEFEKTIERLMKKTTVISATTASAPTSATTKTSPVLPIKGRGIDRIPVTEEEYKNIEYHIKRDIMESSIIEPLLRDPYLEDIHAIGTTSINVVHKVFGMVKTNIQFRDMGHLEHFLRGMSERIGRPVSDAKPIVDATLLDGSRINIIYSEDVSRLGSSFTIRKFAEKPPTMMQLIKWGTFSPEIAAYLWLCLENGMSIFISGETASGKTTSLNAMLNFIDFNSKVYTAEDTPEVIVPQPVWQRLVTREVGPEDARVTLFDLVRAALRSRPNYIIIGEIRGIEGAVAFQAMQTGHAVIATFHASSVQKMIQRFTGDPIRVPVKFMDNLNLALFQQMVYVGGRMARRVISVEEILRYSEAKGGVLTRAVFKWDPVTDTHQFRGMYNSHILENKIAEKLGYDDVREIYKELDYRAKIIQKMVDNGILDYDSVKSVFAAYSDQGFDGLPFKVKRE
jgi:flagellar protein FlaI